MCVYVCVLKGKKEISDIGNRTRGEHVRDANVTNYTISELTFSFIFSFFNQSFPKKWELRITELGIMKGELVYVEYKEFPSRQK